MCDAAACRPSGDDQASGCLASPDSMSLASGAVRPSDGASQDPSVDSGRINQSTVAACAADSLKEAAMPSLREERLVEQVAEIRPQLAKAREIAETARLREP